MSFNLDDIFDTRPQQQQRQYVPPPPPSDPPPPPLVIQQDPFAVNTTTFPPPPPPPEATTITGMPRMPFEAAAHAHGGGASYQMQYASLHAPQSCAGGGYAAPSMPTLSAEPPSLTPTQAVYYTSQPSMHTAYGQSYQASPGVTGVAAAAGPPPFVQSTAMPFASPQPPPVLNVTAPAVQKTDSVLAQEEEDRKQLEKIIQLRKELEKERERERKKREELETWGCPTCTYRNALNVNQCEMCDSKRPGYNPPESVAASATTHNSGIHSSSAPTSKPATVLSGVAGPTAWLCSVCLAPNEAHHSRCKLCGSYQKSGTSITGGNANAMSSAPAVSVHPSAWLCGICGKKNASNMPRCGDCNSYQSSGTPIIDPDAKLEPNGGTFPTVWKCSVCTLENSVGNAVCEACQSGQRPRHLAPPKQKGEKGPGTGLDSHTSPKTWPCPVCTYQNAIEKEKCDMCSTGRPAQFKPAVAPTTRKENDGSGDEIEWQDDEVARECNRCHQPFNFTRRRHHCRACGFVFCGVCSPFQLAVKKNGPLERVCVGCYEAHK